MPFSFLNPWLWVGALAVVAPLYLHLRRKREPNLLRFSAVRFLSDQTRARRRPWSVRDVLLFLLRLGAVILITAAFAWPYLPHAGTFTVAESVVFILDNTLSRQVDDGLDRDRARLVRELRQVGPGEQFAIIELTATPHLLVGFGENQATAEQKIKNLKPSFAHGSYLAAFREANSLLAEAAGRRKRIVLLGDSQANQWDPSVSSPPFLRGLEVDAPKPAAAQMPNLWLTDPAAERLFFGEASKVNLSLRLGHLGAARSAKLNVRVNSKTVLSRSIDLSGQPQNIFIQTQCEADPSAWLNIEAEVEGAPDSLSADNHLFWAVAPVTEGKVSLLAQSPYLRLALSPEVMRGHWAMTALEPAQLEQKRVQEGDVLCIESDFLQSPTARDLVKSFLQSGRGVFLIVNRLTPAIDACLRELGFEPQSMHDDEFGQSSAHFVFADHSIFDAFRSPDFASAMDVRISRYARLRPLAGRPLIISPGGDGLFFEGNKFAGKLFVCAFGFERDQTSWPIQASFIPFLDLTLQAARSGQRSPSSYTPGETAKVSVPDGRPAHTAILSAKNREIIRASFEGGVATLPMPDEPGLYALSFDATGTVENMFSVNPASAESELFFTDPSKPVEAWTLRGGPKPPQGWSSRAPGLARDKVMEQRLWWWLLVAGLLALVGETMLAELKGGRA